MCKWKAKVLLKCGEIIIGCLNMKESNSDDVLRHVLKQDKPGRTFCCMNSEDGESVVYFDTSDISAIGLMPA